MFSFNKDLDDVLQGLFYLAIVGVICLMILSGIIFGYISYYGYKLVKGEIRIHLIEKK